MGEQGLIRAKKGCRRRRIVAVSTGTVCRDVISRRPDQPGMAANGRAGPKRVGLAWSRQPRVRV